MMPAVSSVTRPGTMDPGVEKLLSSLDQLEVKADGSRPDLLFLRSLLESAEFRSMLLVHDMVTTPEAKEPPPIYETASDLVTEVKDMLTHLVPMPEAGELSSLLKDKHVSTLLEAHDQIALKDFQPQLPDVPHEVDEDEESVKIVRLVKGEEEPLGATIQMIEQSSKIRIARVMKGGAADRCGMIQVGDEVQEVNHVKVTGKSPTEVVRILMNAKGPVTLKLVPCDDDLDSLMKESKVRMRALFNYDPSEDTYIPCREAGLSFQRRDILHIVSQDDDNWWQARREGDLSLRAGLIPGRLLQERKEEMKVTVHGEPVKEIKELRSSKSSGKFSPKLGKKTKKSKKHHLEDVSAAEILTYEEVEQYNPDQGIRRTIVLLGPSGVGCSELQNRIVSANPDHYGRPFTCTSRPKKAGDTEADHFTYHSKQELEKELQNKVFLDHWEVKGHTYGTLLDQVQAVHSEGLIPVLACTHPQSLKLLWRDDLKPYFVFIKPPAFDILKSTRRDAAKLHHRDKSVHPFNEDELNSITQLTELMEVNWGHYFDKTLVNGDLETAIAELTELLQDMEGLPQWVPVSWLV